MQKNKLTNILFYYLAIINIIPFKSYDHIYIYTKSSGYITVHNIGNYFDSHGCYSIYYPNSYDIECRIINSYNYASIRLNNNINTFNQTFKIIKI